MKDRELVWAKYRALDLGNNVVVYAMGFHRTTGWKTELVVEEQKDGQTTLALYGERPDIAGQAITPFTVSKVLDPAEAKRVRVRDSRGVHEVKIEEPDKLMTMEQWQRIEFER